MRIIDVREQMPNYTHYHDQYNFNEVHGLAIHHSATVDPNTGLGTQTSAAIFHDQVFNRGWSHGAYHYLVLANGTIEYALDERITGFHAGFHDPDDTLGLECGQYWNNHYLAICLIGWFEVSRTLAGDASQPYSIPDYFTRPTAIQHQSLLQLVEHLQTKYAIPVDNVRGHRELQGSNTRCPGENFDLPSLRGQLLP